ncbi:hypothetical protein SPBR_06171 [Sporothrix brasiliensis 5110]|uniref:Uncharacterized protein n=1 Tax=Sporothrix brasiliensis 5110 TaxID=1398154 RepID=A0A0C2FTY0_9PEZI|nr:uncharacterized protein SPBR_06171 [Sporothrix brasiliensis 5110]KIH94478.1 hypothetical protein SPBR_06171 [Sporothrix brasiliensis 5110]
MSQDAATRDFDAEPQGPAPARRDSTKTRLDLAGAVEEGNMSDRRRHRVNDDAMGYRLIRQAAVPTGAPPTAPKSGLCIRRILDHGAGMNAEGTGCQLRATADLLLERGADCNVARHLATPYIMGVLISAYMSSNRALVRLQLDLDLVFDVDEVFDERTYSTNKNGSAPPMLNQQLR